MNFPIGSMKKSMVDDHVMHNILNMRPFLPPLSIYPPIR